MALAGLNTVVSADVIGKRKMLKYIWLVGVVLVLSACNHEGQTPVPQPTPIPIPSPPTEPKRDNTKYMTERCTEDGIFCFCMNLGPKLPGWCADDCRQMNMCREKK